MSTTGLQHWRLRLILVAVLLALSAVVPAEAGVKNRIEIGSILIEITQGSPAALAGLATTANQGLEKTITYQLPKLTPQDTSVSSRCSC